MVIAVTGQAAWFLVWCGPIRRVGTRGGAGRLQGGCRGSENDSGVVGAGALGRRVAAYLGCKEFAAVVMTRGVAIWRLVV